MKFLVLKELYLTFLTHNDSYMEKIPIGSVLKLINKDLCYNGRVSIDYFQDYLHFGFIEEIK